MINQKVNLNKEEFVSLDNYENIKEDRVLELSIQYFYSSLNDYNDLRNLYSFNLFISNITKAFNLIFQLFLLKNNESYLKSENNSFSFNAIVEKVIIKASELNILIPKEEMEANLKILSKLRNIFEHKAITKEIINIIKYDSYIKKKYIGTSLFLVKNYLYLLEIFFNKYIKINIFPLLISDDFNKELENKINNFPLIKDIDNYIENLDTKIKSNIFSIENFNFVKRKEGYKLLPDIYNDKNWCKSFEFLKKFWKNNPNYKVKKYEDNKNKNFTFRSWPEIYKFLKIEPDLIIPISKKNNTKFFYYNKLMEDKIKSFFDEYNYDSFRKKIRELKNN